MCNWVLLRSMTDRETYIPYQGLSIEGGLGIIYVHLHGLTGILLRRRFPDPLWCDVVLIRWPSRRERARGPWNRFRPFGDAFNNTSSAFTNANDGTALGSQRGSRHDDNLRTGAVRVSPAILNKVWWSPEFTSSSPVYKYKDGVSQVHKRA